MMTPYKGYKAEQSAGAREQLPAGGYVVRIIGAKVEEYTSQSSSNYSKLVIGFDVLEGEYGGFFKRDYESNAKEGKKWRGVYRLSVPDESSEYFDSQKRIFNNAMWAIEESNPGYRWTWNEAELKDKVVGAIFQNQEWKIDGRTGWSTQCYTFTDVNSIRAGKFKIPADKPKQNKAATQNTASTAFASPSAFSAAVDAAPGELPW